MSTNIAAEIREIAELKVKARMALRLDVAKHMAISFRNKFDFSSPSQFDDLATISFTAADALLAKADALEVTMTDLEVKMLTAEHEAKAKAKEAAK